MGWMNLGRMMESKFIDLCSNGDLLGAQQLLKRYPTIGISVLHEEAFRLACLEGHLHVCKWLLQVKPDINISVFNEYPFRIACAKGHLHLAQWLLQVCPTINNYFWFPFFKKKLSISINIYDLNECAFRWSCKNGQLEMVQWLLQIATERGQDINISANDEESFRIACKNGHLVIAQLLQSLKPHLYVINYDEKGDYKNYYIRTKEEANWEKRKYLVWLASNNSPNKNTLLYRLPCDITKMVIGYV